MCTYFGYVLKIETGRDTFCVQEHMVNVWLAIVARTPWLHLVGETATGWGLQSPPRSDWAPRGGLYNHSTVRHSAGFSQWVLCSWHFTGKWGSLHIWLISDLRSLMHHTTILWQCMNFSQANQIIAGWMMLVKVNLKDIWRNC